MIFHEDEEEILASINITDVNEWLEKIIEDTKTIWDLKEWDDFYYIIDDCISRSKIYNYQTCVKKYLETWNAFVTKEEARQELEKRKAIQRIKKYCYENNIKISDKYIWGIFIYSLEYTIITDHDGYPINWFDADDHSNIVNIIWFFEKYKDAHKVIENCEKDLLIIFNI